MTFRTHIEGFEEVIFVTLAVGPNVTALFSTYYLVKLSQLVRLAKATDTYCFCHEYSIFPEIVKREGVKSGWPCTWFFNNAGSCGICIRYFYLSIFS